MKIRTNEEPCAVVFSSLYTCTCRARSQLYKYFQGKYSSTNTIYVCNHAMTITKSVLVCLPAAMSCFSSHFSGDVMRVVPLPVPLSSSSTTGARLLGRSGFLAVPSSRTSPPTSSRLARGFRSSPVAWSTSWGQGSEGRGQSFKTIN